MSPEKWRVEEWRVNGLLIGWRIVTGYGSYKTIGSGYAFDSGKENDFNNKKRAAIVCCMSMNGKNVALDDLLV